jgi:hypothetical protein
MHFSSLSCVQNIPHNSAVACYLSLNCLIEIQTRGCYGGRGPQNCVRRIRKSVIPSGIDTLPSKEIQSVSKSFRTESITKYVLTTINSRWEATQKVMAAKHTRLAHKITIKLHLMAESYTICSSRSRQPVRKLLVTLSRMLFVCVCVCVILNRFLKILMVKGLQFDFWLHMRPKFHVAQCLLSIYYVI